MTRSTSTPRPRRSLTELFWVAARPVLRLQLAQFRHSIRSAPFPEPSGDGAQPVVDVSADRVAWMGSAASPRFGVVDEELTTLNRVAVAVAAARERPFVWVPGVGGVLTVGEAAVWCQDESLDVDATVVALGFTDVLLMTSVRDWTAGLDVLLDRARRTGTVLSPVIMGGIPPMDRFRQTPRWGRERIRTQVQRLNEASARLVRDRGDCVFVPFPDPDVGDARLGDELYSWARVHQLWAAALAPEIVRLLDEHA
jgi:hypothetical protein